MLPCTCGHRGCGCGGRPCGALRRSVPDAVLDGCVSAGAEQCSHYGSAARAAIAAVTGSLVQRRATTPASNGGTGSGTGPPRPHQRPRRPPRGPPAVGLDVQRCAGVDERMDGQQRAAPRRIVQRCPPIPVQARLGRGRGDPEGYPTSLPVPSHTAYPEGTRFLFCVLEQTAARGTGRTRAYRPPHVLPH
jgi:hypothetical protein